MWGDDDRGCFFPENTRESYKGNSPAENNLTPLVNNYEGSHLFPLHQVWRFYGGDKILYNTFKRFVQWSGKELLEGCGSTFSVIARTPKIWAARFSPPQRFWHVRNVNRFFFWSKEDRATGGKEKVGTVKLKYQLSSLFFSPLLMTTVLKCMTAGYTFSES